MQLRPRHQPYDGRRLLWFLGRHAVPGVEAYTDGPAGPTYGRVLRLPGGPGVAWVGLAAGGFELRLVLSEPADEAEAVARVRGLLDLDGDPTAGIAALGADPLLGPLVAARPGLRTPGSADPVETLVTTIIGQQVSLAGARTVTGRVVAAYGVELPRGLAGGGLTHSFPTAVALAGADPEQLPMPRARGRSLVAVGRAVAEQGEELVSGSAGSRPALLALPGVGPWTAAYLALRVGRDPDVFLPTDLGVRRVLERHGRPGDPMSASAVSDAWSPHRSLALMHLWVDLLESRSV